MKFCRTIILALIVPIMILTSCAKDDEDDFQNPPDTVSVVIDGTDWIGMVTNVAYSGGTAQLNAIKNSDNSGIQIFFPENAKGTYDLATTNDVTISYSENNGSVFWNNNLSGSITFDSNTMSNISGSFNVVLTSAFNSDTLTLTKGFFNWTF